MKLPDNVISFISSLQRDGFACYAVGGCVRDMFLDRPVKDWDFTTDATPEQIQKIFPESFYDNKYGTVGVKLKNDKGETEQVFEITPFRKEGVYSDSRHPDKIEWAKTIEEDLGRRDFTINAIAVTIQKGGVYLVVDPFDGQNDLDYCWIRAVGEPDKRFSEDALRLMRAIRLATQLGFKIEEKTWEAIKKNSGSISKVSSERVRDELIKIFSSDFPADGVRLLQNAGLLKEILPELTLGIGINQVGTHHKDDVFTHSLKALEHCESKNWLVRFATLLHDIGKAVTYKEKNGKATFYNHEVVGAHLAKDIADRLHFKKEDREKLYLLVRWHMFSVSEFLTDTAVRRFIRRVGVENTTDMLDLRTADRLGSGTKATSWRHEDFKKRILEVQKHIPSVTDLKINGKDVMEILKIQPGPQVGKILSLLFEEIIEDPERNSKEYLEKRVKEIGK